MSKLILGTVQFGLNYGINNSIGKPDRAKVFAILDHAWANGIHILDTAVDYGNAIEVIAAYHQQSNNRFQIISKFKNEADFDLKSSIEETIASLDIPNLLGLLFHKYDDFFAYPELIDELVELKAKKRLQKIGISIYSNQQLEDLLDYAHLIDIIQLPYNLLDNYTQRGDLIRAATSRGIEIHTRSAFLQGLFFKPTDTLPASLTPLIPHLQNIQNITADNSIPLAQLAIQYAAANKDIDKVLIGVETLEQLKANLKAIQAKPINGKTMALLDAIQVAQPELLQPVNW